MSRRSTPAAWAQIPEKKGLLGMKIMVRCCTLLGRRAFSILLYPVMLVFYLSSPAARRASAQFLHRVEAVRQQRGLKAEPGRFSSFRHFYSFGQTLMDKILSWQGRLQLGREVFFAPGAREVLDACPGGQIMLVSHLGDIELCRALVAAGKLRRITALVFHHNAARFAQIMREFAPGSELNLIALSDFGPELALTIQDLIQQGHIVAIAADRLAVPGRTSAVQRCSSVPFLGAEAPFAHGPWILASLMHCPVTAMFALREQGKIMIYTHLLSQELRLGRRTREADLRAVISAYARILEDHALRHPYEWFNFFDFWVLPEPAAAAADSKSPGGRTISPGGKAEQKQEEQEEQEKKLKAGSLRKRL